MLSRLMTRKEQVLLLGVGVAICMGAGALYFHSRAFPNEDPDPQVVIAAPIEAVKAAPLDPVSSPTAPTPEPLALITPIPEPEPDLAVSATGAVQEPGVYRLREGARVQDLLDAAQGVREDADLSDINLAARVIDGTTVVIPSRATASREGANLRVRSSVPASSLNLPQYTISGWRSAEIEPAVPAPATESAAYAAPPAAGAPSSGLIDLNTATQDGLESLPGIGPKTAEKIIAYRQRVPFRSVDDLANVSGIGPKKLDAVRALVTVQSAPAAPASPPRARSSE